MLQPDHESIMQTIQSLAQQIEEIEHQIGDLVNEAMELSPLQYLILQREIDRLVITKRALQDKWNQAMDVLTVYRSAHPTPHQFDQDHVPPRTR
jgi:plasmid maintenance system antidote protein VapI